MAITLGHFGLAAIRQMTDAVRKELIGAVLLVETNLASTENASGRTLALAPLELPKKRMRRVREVEPEAKRETILVSEDCHLLHRILLRYRAKAETVLRR